MPNVGGPEELRQVVIKELSALFDAVAGGEAVAENLDIAVQCDATTNQPTGRRTITLTVREVDYKH